MTFLAVKSGTLVGDDHETRMLFEFVIEAGNPLNIGGGSLNALDDHNLASAAELLRNPLCDLHARRVVSHTNEAGVRRGDVLVHRDHRDTGLLRLFDSGRQPGGVRAWSPVKLTPWLMKPSTWLVCFCTLGSPS
jgi:hypothetical protein